MADWEVTMKSTARRKNVDDHLFGRIGKYSAFFNGHITHSGDGSSVSIDHLNMVLEVEQI